MRKYKDVIIKYIIITFGTAVVGFSLSCFLAPNDIICGGISGIATIIYHFTKFPLGIASLILNIPIFIWGIIKLGKSLGIATIYGTVAMSIFIDIFAVFGSMTDDLFLAAIYGGFFGGIGNGLVFYVNATTGGVDIIAKIIQLKKRHIQIGRILLLIDLIIIGGAIVAYNNINIGLYSIVALFVTSFVIDRIIEGFNFAKLTFIISDKHSEISSSINLNLSRGATLLDGYGSYTGNDKKIIMCTIKTSEIPMLKDIIKSKDENAFVLITDVREVFGEGFLKY